jgi:hypothetical protein
MISVFEGGYNVKLNHISPLGQSVSAHVRALATTHSGEYNQEQGIAEE